MAAIAAAGINEIALLSVFQGVTLDLPDACDLCARRETPILEIARSKDFSLEKLKEALKRSAEIH